MDWMEGAERLEMWPPMGRPTRQGSPSELAVGDADRVVEALRGADEAKALAYMEYVRMGHYFVLAGYAEWILRWPAALMACSTEEMGQTVYAQAYARWCEAAQVPHEALRMAFHPEHADSAYIQSAVQEVTGRSKAFLDRAVAAVSSDWAAAERDFEAYMRTAIEDHDAMGRLVWALGGEAARMLGQEAAQQAHEHSFSHCSFFEAMWAPIGQAPPEALAFSLAEHLRAHFSGPGRRGSVQIIEEADRFRLVLDPCGSGGAMRRAAADVGQDVFATPGPLTWGRPNVPSYCSHCALNEMISIRRVGYRAWVTEYDPDPNKPCGWTVYKKP